MTPAQLQLIHTARRQLGLDESDYRLILRNIGNVASSKDLTHQAFERVMSFFESRGWRQPGKPSDYWQRTRQRTSPTRPQLFQIRRLHASCERYDLAGLAERMSHGRTRDVAELHPREAYALIEALKAILARDFSAPKEEVATDRAQMHTDQPTHSADLCPICAPSVAELAEDTPCL